MYPTKKLSEICIIWPKKSEVSKLDSETLVSFVPMRDVKEWEKYFIPSESKKIKDVYSGYTYFNDEDVLLAKVTPCFENGKSWIAKNLVNRIWFWSSEFYVFRCNSEVIPEYLYRVISSQKFLKKWAENMSWAVWLKRVTKEFIENYEIPFPPLPTQSLIVARLDSAFASIDEQISLLRANIGDVENMRKSVLEESFRQKWVERKVMKDILTLCEYGSSKKSTDDDSWIPVLRMGNIQNWWVDYNNLKYTSKDSEDLPKLYLKKYDLLFL